MFRRGRGVVRMAAVAAAGASCLAAAACGGISASSLSAAPSASSTPDPLASLTARNVATEAVANLRTASSLKMAGTVNESGQHVVLNLDLKPGHGCAGTIVVGRATVYDPRIGGCEPAQWAPAGARLLMSHQHHPFTSHTSRTHISGKSPGKSVTECAKSFHGTRRGPGRARVGNPHTTPIPQVTGVTREAITQQNYAGVAMSLAVVFGQTVSGP